MRYGRYYQLKVDLRPDYTGPNIEVFALRDDWATQKAFQLAYSAYLKNSSEERAMLTKSQVARWEDFRIEDGLVLTGGVNQARPIFHQASGGGATILNAGEFLVSTITDATDVDHTFTWGVGTVTKYSVLEEYDKAGNTPVQPDTISGSAGDRVPYANLTTGVDWQMGFNLQDRGNNPPYDAESVTASSPWVRIGVLGSGAVGQQRFSTGFFTAPCGLILLKGFTETSEAYSVTIEAKSGDYKGVHAPSMLE
ncbi:MAG: hypothetical protein ACO22U_16880 [bacterium]